MGPTLVNQFLGLQWDSLKYSHANEAFLFALVLAAVLLFALTIKLVWRKAPGRRMILLPGIAPGFKKARFSFVRHTSVVLFFAGLFFFTIALADPYLSFTKGEVIYPGKKIVVILDASSSMGGQFLAEKLRPERLKELNHPQDRFFTAAKAAEYFIELRIKGKYKDLIGLVEFGNEAYVITPFTNDYQNILTSIRLIAEPEERNRFIDSGTIIVRAIDQGVALFKAFKFIETPGNAMVLISDGEDNTVEWQGIKLESVLSEAVTNKIPIYFIRTNYMVDLQTALYQSFGVADPIWKDAVEKTGGKFYIGKDENSIIEAVHDIDKINTGTIKVSEYSARQPRFQPFIIAASLLWVLAFCCFSFFKLFRQFP